MDEDQLFLRACKPPPAEISEDAYRITDDLDFIKKQLSQLSRIPTRHELIRFSVWVALGLLRACAGRAEYVVELGLGV